jgi:transcriptional regulator with XRE-family HTH domain
MKERLLEFLKAENKSSAQLAEEIGVQASGISHILSGRNNPSLDFVIKMLEKYTFLSTDWLLFGKGSMYIDSKMQTLFDEGKSSDQNEEIVNFGRKFTKNELEFIKPDNNKLTQVSPEQPKSKASDIKKIIWFYENNSFEEFFPR